MPSVAEKRATFRALHARGCFVMPNPWDVGSARYLQHLGFPALATTSAGAAFALGLPDNGMPRDSMLAHIGALAAASDVPMNADYGSGYATTLDDLVRSVRACIDTGVAGLSIEDATDDATAPLFELDFAVARVRAARAAIDMSGADVVLTARAECHLVGHPAPLEESLRRLRAYAAVGADCLYAPGLRTADDIRAVIDAVTPTPVNVLVGAPLGLSVADLANLGVRRVSVGSALARCAWGGLQRAARAIAEEGSFAGLAEAPPFAELNRFFEEDAARRGSGT